jgi:ketosteroid isomerase-like protein
MMKHLLAVAIVLSACGSELAPDPAQLMDADRAFDSAVAEGGSAAWVSWFADDGAMIQEGVGEIRGHSAIGEAMASLDNPNISLRWDPERAEIATSGDLGWTTGSWTFSATGSEGLVTTNQGRYVSIWRRQPNGSWKVVMDLGNPTNANPSP